MNEGWGGSQCLSTSGAGAAYRRWRPTAHNLAHISIELAAAAA